MNDLVELFAENAAAAGFTVHREGDAPEESSRALYGLADTGSVVLAAAGATALIGLRPKPPIQIGDVSRRLASKSVPDQAD